MQTAFDWEFDFDSWSELASSDPEAFEKQREALVNQAIAYSAEEHQQRLKCLQWRIDKVRERSGTAMAACIRISGMMWDNVMGQGGLVDNLQALREATLNMDGSGNLKQLTATNLADSATILAFPGKAATKQQPQLAVEEELP